MTMYFRRAPRQADFKGERKFLDNVDSFSLYDFFLFFGKVTILVL